jgi:hypothetical protein
MILAVRELSEISVATDEVTYVTKRKRVPLAEKIKWGHFLSLTELSKVRGMSIKKLSALAQNRESNGFPLFDKKIRLSDFDAWYHRQISFEISAPQDTEPFRQSGAGPQHSDVSKPRGHLGKCDSKPALQPFR